MNGHFRVEPRLGDDAHRLPEPHHQRLPGLIDREEGAVGRQRPTISSMTATRAANETGLHWLPPDGGCGAGAGAARPREIAERQIGHDAGAALRPGIDDGLVGAAEHALHGFQIHALAGHVGRLLVLLIDLGEARGLALGLGDGLLAIGFGVLDDLGGAAARFRHDAIGVGLRLVLRPLEIGARRLHVAEGVDDLGRRIDLLQLHLLHQDAGAVIVERLLHQLLDRGLDGLPRAGEDRPGCSECPITARMALSPTAFTVDSGFCTLKR